MERREEMGETLESMGRRPEGIAPSPSNAYPLLAHVCWTPSPPCSSLPSNSRLVAMTFNIWWILSVVIGSGVGEIMFGRFGPSSADH